MRNFYHFYEFWEIVAFYQRFKIHFKTSRFFFPICEIHNIRRFSKNERQFCHFTKNYFCKNSTFISYNQKVCNFFVCNRKVTGLLVGLLKSSPVSGNSRAFPSSNSERHIVRWLLNSNKFV